MQHVHIDRLVTDVNDVSKHLYHDPEHLAIQLLAIFQRK